MIRRCKDKYWLYCDVCYKKADIVPNMRAWFDTRREVEQYERARKWRSVYVRGDRTEVCPDCFEKVRDFVRELRWQSLEGGVQSNEADR